MLFPFSAAPRFRVRFSFLFFTRRHRVAEKPADQAEFSPNMFLEECQRSAEEEKNFKKK